MVALRMTSGYRDPTLSPIEDPAQLEELFPRCTPKTTPTNTPSARKANKTLLSDGSNPEKKSTEKKRRTKKKGTKKTNKPAVIPGDVAVDNILDLNFSHEPLPNAMSVRPSPLGLANHNVNMVLSPTTTPPSWQMSQLGETKIPNPHGGSALEPQTASPKFPASHSKLKDTKIEIAGIALAEAILTNGSFSVLVRLSRTRDTLVWQKKFIWTCRLALKTLVNLLRDEMCCFSIALFFYFRWTRSLLPKSLQSRSE